MDIAIVVRLKATDPAAVTALSTLQRLKPDIWPVELHRFDHWLFREPEAGRDTVEEIVSHFHDIVNPNKQTWHFTDDPELLETSGSGTACRDVLVTDRVDSISENWSSIMRRRGFHVAGVVYSVLWRFVYGPEVTFEEAGLSAMTLTRSSRRDSGLLANPVSQEIRLLDRT